jgi:hypothetical protein
MPEGIQGQELGNAKGFGFAPGNMQNIRDTSAPVSSFLASALPGAAELLLKKKAQMDNSAFLQGQSDKLAGIVTEQSWLTEDSYKQGGAYQTYSDELAAFPSALQEDARVAAEAGEDLATYTKRVQPKLKLISDRMSELGLKDEALDAAQKQLLGTMAGAQKVYQSAREQETLRKIDRGNSAINSTAVSAIQATNDADTISFSLTSAFQNTYQANRMLFPKEANTTASKNTFGAIQVAVSGLNPANAEDVQKLRGIDAWLRSDAAAVLDPDVRAKALGMTNGRFKDVQDAQQVYDQQTVQGLDMQVKQGGAIDLDVFDAEIANAEADMRSGRKTPQQAEQYINSIHGIRMRATKDLGKGAFLVGAQTNDVLANGHSLADQTKATLQSITKQFGTDYAGASAAGIALGQNQRNMGTITASAQLATSQFISAFTMTGKELETVNDGQQGDAFNGFVSMYKEGGVNNNPGMQAALLDAVPKEDQAAVELYMRELPEGAPSDLRSAVPAIAQIKQRIVDFQARGGTAGVRIARDVFESKLWGGSADTAGAELGNQPSDTVLEVQAANANSIYVKNAMVLATKGYTVMDGVSATKAMVKENMVMRTKAGPVFINPDWVKAVGVEGVASNSQFLADTINKRRGMYAEFVGGRVEPENVVVEVRGTTTVLRGYDSKGNPMQEQYISAGDIKADIDNTIKSSAANAPRQLIGTAQAGRATFGITADWGGAFGNNYLGAQIGQHIANAEGYVTRPTKTDTRFTDDEVIGIGVNLTANPKWRKEFEAVRSPEEMAQVTGRFVKEHYKGWGSVVEAAGLPDSNATVSRVYEGGGMRDPSSYRAAYIGLADAWWHGGKGGGDSYAAILLKAKTDAAGALSDLKGTTYYKQSGKSRQKSLELGVQVIR